MGKSKRSSGKDQDVEVSETESEASDQKHEDSQVGTVSKRVSSAMLKADRIPLVTFKQHTRWLLSLTESRWLVRCN